MRNRRTWLVRLAALGLIALSLAAMDFTLTSPAPAAATGWQVTLLKDGKPIRSARHEQFPSDLHSCFPEFAAGAAYSVIVEPTTPAASDGAGPTFAPADRPLVEFLLLLPPATLLVCVARNVIGLNSFGTFAPALLGLAFRDVESLLGLFVVLTIISAGWWLRRGLNELHLLQVPRTALLLSCIVVLLLALFAALGGSGPRALTLFPLVILTGMIERFWSMDEEDGTSSSLGVLASTLFIAGCVWALAMLPAVSSWMMRHPATLGLVMAGQLLLGRYSGLRWLELYRFRALADCRSSLAA